MAAEPSAPRSALEHTQPPRAVGAVADTALAFGREARALLWQSTLMHCDLGVVRPADLRSKSDLVVVLHGLFATAGALRPLRRRIERDTGFETATFTYEPGCNVQTLVGRLSDLLESAPASCRVRLVGHSLGGIVARYYVQVAPRDPRVVQTLSLASPFAGTHITRWVPDFFCRDVNPDSVVLARLERSWECGAGVPHTSFVATHDQLVRPSLSAAYPHGEVVMVEACGHNTLLFDNSVASLLTNRILHPTTPQTPRADVSNPTTQSCSTCLVG